MSKTEHNDTDIGGDKDPEAQKLENLRKENIPDHRKQIRETVIDVLEDTGYNVEPDDNLEKNFLEDTYIGIRLALDDLESEVTTQKAFANAFKSICNAHTERIEELENKGRLYHLKKALTLFPK